VAYAGGEIDVGLVKQEAPVKTRGLAHWARDLAASDLLRLKKAGFFRSQELQGATRQFQALPSSDGRFPRKIAKAEGFWGFRLAVPSARPVFADDILDLPYGFCFLLFG
jgi:hypothetical protein